MTEYKPRIADSLLSDKLEGTGAVLIEGMKWCGKTTTAEQKAHSIIYLDEPGKKLQYINIAALDPQKLLLGKYPRLLDEWQIVPELWDAVRFSVDHGDQDGMFILTGSAVPLSEEEKQKISHSGTGRIGRIKMRTMSLWESRESSGEVSLKDLFASKNDIYGTGETDLEKIAYYMCRGGWPKSISQRPQIALGRAFDYYDAIVNTDISRTDKTLTNPERVKLILRSYARHQGAQVSIASIRDDIKSNDIMAMDERTVASYIETLRKIFVIEDMPSWNPNLRSKIAIRSSDTRYFSDPSIASASLGLGPSDLINDLETFGLLFETMCARDLRVYAEALGGTVYHYRDSSGLECDAVIHLRNGSYGLIEIKLGGDNAIENGVKTLEALTKKIDTTRMKAPSFKMVLTAVGPFAYRRADGIYVVPITTLKD
ncbi:MAG: ATP-binding protein [Bacteroides sp.]|nr:ATP-binding protein [Bacteroides sp.]